MRKKIELQFFDKSEFTCAGENCFNKMDRNFLMMLDDAREYADVPFKITSSWRSKEHNEKIGGAKNSAHLRGCAVDIACDNSKDRMAIVEGLLGVGFARIGIAKTFIHADNDLELPPCVMWLY